MEEKIEKIITIIVIIGLIIYVLVAKIVPQLKESLGSSDSFLFSSKYQDMIEFEINNNLNFALVTKNNQVVHLLIFTDQATCLYNQNIENKSIVDSIKLMTNILINTNNLKNDSTITLINYENISYASVKNTFLQELITNNLNIIINEKNSSLEQKATDLGLESTSKEGIILNLDFYSKNIISKNYSENTDISISKPPITEEQSKEYANNVYKKLQNYVITNNIGEQDIDSAALPISLIPASSDGTIFPSTSSWYYITNQQVYAYIVFESETTTYDYCYQGSITEYKKGEC